MAHSHNKKVQRSRSQNIKSILIVSASVVISTSINLAISPSSRPSIDTTQIIAFSSMVITALSFLAGCAFALIALQSSRDFSSLQRDMDSASETISQGARVQSQLRDLLSKGSEKITEIEMLERRANAQIKRMLRLRQSSQALMAKSLLECTLSIEDSFMANQSISKLAVDFLNAPSPDVRERISTSISSSLSTAARARQRIGALRAKLAIKTSTEQSAIFTAILNLSELGDIEDWNEIIPFLNRHKDDAITVAAQKAETRIRERSGGAP